MKGIFWIHPLILKTTTTTNVAPWHTLEDRVGEGAQVELGRLLSVEAELRGRLLTQTLLVFLLVCRQIIMRLTVMPTCLLRSHQNNLHTNYGFQFMRTKIEFQCSCFVFHYTCMKFKDVSIICTLFWFVFTQQMKIQEATTCLIILMYNFMPRIWQILTNLVRSIRNIHLTILQNSKMNQPLSGDLVRRCMGTETALL